MYTPIQKQTDTDQSSDKQNNRKQQAEGFGFSDNRMEAAQLKEVREMADHHAAKQASFSQNQTNSTGIPENLKRGTETLSGFALDDVKVHYNSGKPAQLHAHAYAQGTDIHIASGQEKHLPHEVWHVVQQKQGRVKPTLQMKGKIGINEDAGLEKEADEMGRKANNLPASATPDSGHLVQRAVDTSEVPVQLLTIDDEKITKNGVTGKKLKSILKNFLLDNNLSPHGFVKFFENEIVSMPDDLSLREFIPVFFNMAVKEKERVNNLKKGRKKGDKKITSWTRELKLNRPAWTKEHKEMSNAGQDIRHIVRNATIKNAIYGEYQFQLTQKNTRVFTQMAKELGIDPGSHPWEAMKNIYNKAYLNQLNLFAGGSGVNRVIGLTADPLILYGKEIKEFKIDEESVIDKIYSNVSVLIQNQITATTQQAEKLKKGGDTFIEGMEEFEENLTDYLEDAYEQWLVMFEDEDENLANVISAEVVDIGLNFGFDMPGESNPELMKMLLHVEQTLGDYQPGNSNQLAEVLYFFLNQKKTSIDIEEKEPVEEDIPNVKKRPAQKELKNEKKVLKVTSKSDVKQKGETKMEFEEDDDD